MKEERSGATTNPNVNGGGMIRLFKAHLPLSRCHRIRHPQIRHIVDAGLARVGGIENDTNRVLAIRRDRPRVLKSNVIDAINH